MFWKVLRHIFVPSSGLEENNIKGAFYPEAPLACCTLPICYTNYHVLNTMQCRKLMGAWGKNSTKINKNAPSI